MKNDEPNTLCIFHLVRIFIEYECSEKLIHSHNDCRQQLPFYQAYSQQLSSIRRGSDNFFVLLIDLKTPANPTLDRLIKKLQQYPEVFDPAINPYAVRVVVSGSRPNENTFNDFPSIVSFDGSRTEDYG